MTILHGILQGELEKLIVIVVVEQIGQFDETHTGDKVEKLRVRLKILPPIDRSWTLISMLMAHR